MNSIRLYLKLSGAVSGDSLDANETRQLMSAISAVLHGRLARVTRELHSERSTRILKQPASRVAR